MNTNQIELDKVLAEPKIDKISDRALRIRKTIIILSSLALFFLYFGVEVKIENFLSIKFIDLSSKHIHIAFLLIISYLLISYIFEILEHILYLRIRITGSKISHVTTAILSSELGDYPNNPEQSSLYNWWVSNRGCFLSSRQLDEKLDSLLVMKDEFNELVTSNPTDFDRVRNSGVKIGESFC